MWLFHNKKKSFQFEVWTNIWNKCVIKHSQTERMSNGSNVEIERKRERKQDQKKKTAKTSTLAHSLAICNLKTVILPLWNIIYRMVLPVRRYVVRTIIFKNKKKLFEKHKLIWANQSKTLNAYMCVRCVHVCEWKNELWKTKTKNQSNRNINAYIK